jgi:hypothetical protein
LVAETEDEDVDDFEFTVGDVGKRGLDAEFSTEGYPNAEDVVSALGGLGSVGGIGDLQCSDEISCEAVTGGRWSSCQGVLCG